jgi:hypothetical protein
MNQLLKNFRETRTRKSSPTANRQIADVIEERLLAFRRLPCYLLFLSSPLLAKV